MNGRDAIDILMGALADIATSPDMTLEMARKKAKRIHDGMNTAYDFPPTPEDIARGGQHDWLCAIKAAAEGYLKSPDRVNRELLKAALEKPNPLEVYWKARPQAEASEKP